MLISGFDNFLFSIVMRSRVHPLRVGCVGANQIFDADEIFVSYMSLTTPKTVYQYNMRTTNKEVVKVTPVNGFDASKYDTMRTEVTVRDGVKVPVSIAYRKDLRTKNGRGGGTCSHAHAGGCLRST